MAMMSIIRGWHMGHSWASVGDNIGTSMGSDWGLYGSTWGKVGAPTASGKFENETDPAKMRIGETNGKNT